MIDNIKKSLVTGIARVKWIAAFLSERIRVETSIAKLLYKRSRLEDEMDDLYRAIGKRVMELKNLGREEILKDFMIQQTLSDIKDMNEAAQDYKKEADNISKLREE